MRRETGRLRTVVALYVDTGGAEALDRTKEALIWNICDTE